MGSVTATVMPEFGSRVQALAWHERSSRQATVAPSSSYIRCALVQILTRRYRARFCLVYHATFHFDTGKTSITLMSQSQTAVAPLSGVPLTTLSEDETMFRSSVREFAEGELRPRVEHMDEAAKLDPAIIKQCFDLGLMGIETPEEYGGAAANFFTAILAVEELSRVDASVGVFVDVQNTLVNNAFIRWGTPEQKKKYLTKLAADSVSSLHSVARTR